MIHIVYDENEEILKAAKSLYSALSTFRLTPCIDNARSLLRVLRCHETIIRRYILDPEIVTQLIDGCATVYLREACITGIQYA